MNQEEIKDVKLSENSVDVSYNMFKNLHERLQGVHCYQDLIDVLGEKQAEAYVAKLEYISSRAKSFANQYHSGIKKKVNEENYLPNFFDYSAHTNFYAVLSEEKDKEKKFELDFEKAKELKKWFEDNTSITSSTDKKQVKAWQKDFETVPKKMNIKMNSLVLFLYEKPEEERKKLVQELVEKGFLTEKHVEKLKLKEDFS